ncbi:MAG: tetratricopeptide repeat protein [Gammaproteobacteria bacterium]|nr:tetratricopeptide repeat protein [Gammaproteobacteria bacterium]MDD9851302.1 tetratricopeptide repeat protein [Gammaproteobacteria bacterium]MDD9870116.1 tetratricopeptide repeat protein [Gammaproteobacteria bacterium]
MNRCAAAGLLCAALSAAACVPVGEGGDSAVRAGLHVDLAEAYLKEGRLAVALAEIESGLAAAPQNPRAHYVMGLVRRRLGDDDAAARHLQKALALAPQNPRFAAEYATALCARGDYGEALAHFAQVNADPLNEAPAATLARAGGCRLRAGDVDGAERDFRRALGYASPPPAVLINLAGIQFQRRKFFQARAFLERYFAAAEVTPQSLLLGVKVERALGDGESAGVYAARLRAAWPRSAEARQLEEL